MSDSVEFSVTLYSIQRIEAVFLATAGNRCNRYYTFPTYTDENMAEKWKTDGKKKLFECMFSTHE